MALGPNLNLTWTGTAANTVLTGSGWGSNTFVLGAGSDQVTFGNGSLGGSNQNTVLFGLGDGQVVINPNGGVGTIQMAAGISAADLTYQVDDATRDLFITVGGAGSVGDKLTLKGDLYNNWGVQSRIGIGFADGTTLDVGPVLTFIRTGTATNTDLVGSGWGANTFVLGAGGDHVTFGTGSHQGSNQNIVLFHRGDGAATVNTNGAQGLLKLGSGISRADVMLTTDLSGDLKLSLEGATDSLTVAQALAPGNTAIQSPTFADGTTWGLSQLAFLANTGTAGASTLAGTTGNDILDGQGKATLIIGGGGNHTYLMRQGYGAVAIDNATNNGGAAQGEIDFGRGVSEQNLWFTRSGDDLVAQILGSADAVDVKSSFGSNPSAQVAGFTAYDGLKLGGQVGQLVSAMATFATSSPGFDPTKSTMPVASSLQAALGTAWHS